LSTRVAINGFGRIGRNFRRAAHERGADIEIVAVNDVTDAATLAQLLAFDSVYGRFPAAVRAGEGTITIDGQEVRVLAEREPADLPWSELGAEVVIESTGSSAAAMPPPTLAGRRPQGDHRRPGQGRRARRPQRRPRRRLRQRL
jgi:glyceraldehyde-3-phosphate dehydrogenase/erythrose-4-phosphate dehydrogenase